MSRISRLLDKQRFSRALVEDSPVSDFREYANGRTVGRFLVSASHASPIPRLWPCSSSEGRPPRGPTGSAFGTACSCSTSVAVR
jgi:hypothetical protein